MPLEARRRICGIDHWATRSDDSVKRAGSDLGFITLCAASFARAGAQAIDYAVMERTQCAAVMPVSYGWSDVASWQAVWELSDRDLSDHRRNGSAGVSDKTISQEN
jgi:mannose-1-phosphate guanylyltransferase